MPFSKAKAIENGFIVEPGSNVSVNTRFLSCSPLKLVLEFGLYVGQFAKAKISPVCTSRTTAPAALARCFSATALSSLNAKNCTLLSTDNCKSAPSLGG